MMMIIFHDLFCWSTSTFTDQNIFSQGRLSCLRLSPFSRFSIPLCFCGHSEVQTFNLPIFQKKKYLSTEFCCNLFDKFSVGWSFSKFLLDRSEMSASRSKKFHKILILFMGYNDRTHKNKKCSCVDEISIFLTFANVYFNFFHKTELTRNLFSNYIFWYNTRNYKLD